MNRQYFNIPGHEGNKIIFFVHRHWITLLGTIFLVIASFLGPIIILSSIYFNFPQLLSGVILNIVVIVLSIYYLILISYAFTEWLRFYYDALICTENELVKVEQEGILNRRIIEIPLVQILNVLAQSKGFLKSAFSFGEIILEIGGKNPRVQVFSILPNPVSLAGKILEAHNQEVDREKIGEKIEGAEQKLRDQKVVTEFSTKESVHETIIPVEYERSEQEIEQQLQEKRRREIEKSQEVKVKKGKSVGDILYEEMLGSPGKKEEKKSTVDILYDEILGSPGKKERKKPFLDILADEFGTPSTQEKYVFEEKTKPKSAYDIVYEETLGHPQGLPKERVLKKVKEPKSALDIIYEETIGTPPKNEGEISKEDLERGGEIRF